jgi:hypothetical protein
VLLPPGFPSERNLNPLAEREEGGWEDKVLKFQSAIKAVFMTVKKGTGKEWRRNRVNVVIYFQGTVSIFHIIGLKDIYNVLLDRNSTCM